MQVSYFHCFKPSIMGRLDVGSQHQEHHQDWIMMPLFFFFFFFFNFENVFLHVELCWVDIYRNINLNMGRA